jgi:hypothetical protein
MASKAMIGKTGSKSAKAKFSTAPSSHPDGTSGSGVRVSPGKGGAGRIGPSSCTSKRGAPNVTEGAYGHG